MAQGIEKKDSDTKPTTITGVKGKPESAKKAKSSPAKNPDNDLVDIDELAETKGLPGWEKAAFFRAAGWAAGKKATEKAFGQGLKKFRERQLGSGKI
jgi:hypothetical protein